MGLFLRVLLKGNYYYEACLLGAYQCYTVQAVNTIYFIWREELGQNVAILVPLLWDLAHTADKAISPSVFCKGTT